MLLLQSDDVLRPLIEQERNANKDAFGNPGRNMIY